MSLENTGPVSPLLAKRSYRRTQSHTDKAPTAMITPAITISAVLGIGTMAEKNGRVRVHTIPKPTPWSVIPQYEALSRFFSGGWGNLLRRKNTKANAIQQAIMPKNPVAAALSICSEFYQSYWTCGATYHNSFRKDFWVFTTLYPCLS